jgi:hypothetical protein
MLLFKPFGLQVIVLPKDALLQDSGGSIGGIPLQPDTLPLRVHCQRLEVALLCKRNLFTLPDRNLSVNRMVLYKSMIAHKLHRTIAFLWVISGGVTFPDSNWRRGADNNSMRLAKI